MKNALPTRSYWLSKLGLIACLGAIPIAAAALTDDDDAPRFVFGEEDASQRAAKNADAEARDTADAPVRLARFCYVQGDVYWRTSETAQWSAATANLPIRQGAQIWIEGKGRAELQFDDGSYLRLGTNALLTLQTLYSDMEGTFTEIKLQEGLASLRLRHKLALYQIDTPFASVKATGPAKLRVGVGTETEIALREGEATLEGAQGSYTLRKNDYLLLSDAMSPYRARRIPREDSWDQWNRERDQQREETPRPSQEYLPKNIAVVADSLDDYGAWERDDRYGYVWCPRAVGASWRPYSDGRWVWVAPFGWTWVSNEPWGWAPYHYGSWVRRHRGWAWVPGPAVQCWSPAVVHFSRYDDHVAWVPLAPEEVIYPRRASAFSIRMGAYFSILSAGVYYAASDSYCVARPYRAQYVNNVTNIVNITNVTNVTNVRPSDPYASAAAKLNFRARNLREGEGGTVVPIADFRSGSSYRPAPKYTAAQYLNARSFAAPSASQQPVAGPPIIRPTEDGTTPTRHIERTRQPRAEFATRNVYRAPLPAKVESSQPAEERNAAADRINADRREGSRNPAFGFRDRAYSPDRDRISRPANPSATEPSRPRSAETPSAPPSRAEERPAPSPAEAARRARESFRRERAPETPRPIESQPSRREEAPRTETPRRESPTPLPQRERPRENPTPQAPERPTERPRREAPLPEPRREAPERPIERPRREAPAPEPRREAPERPVERPRREAPAPEPRREAPPRQEPPQRREAPAPPPQRQEPPRREAPAPRPEQPRSPANPRERRP